MPGAEGKILLAMSGLEPGRWRELLSERREVVVCALVLLPPPGRDVERLQRQRDRALVDRVLDQDVRHDVQRLHRRVRAGRQLRGDLLEQQVHRRDRDVRQHQGGAGVARGADRAEDVGRAIALVLHHPRPHAALEPAADHAALLAYAGLVLEPDLDPLGLGLVGRDLRKRGGEAFFLNASWAARSVSACRGRGVCQDRSRSCISRPMPVSP